MSRTFPLGDTPANVERYVNRAIKNLYSKDGYLLINRSSERSITHKLAEYLQQIYKRDHVDCEFNKYWATDSPLPSAKMLFGKKVFPDIVIHARGLPENYVVLEAKKYATGRRADEAMTKDRKRLEEFTNPAGEFVYKFGVFIVFHKMGFADLEWYENGRFVRSTPRITMPRSGV